jgi:glycolate oxidase iron-sulfur subunit
LNKKVALHLPCSSKLQKDIALAQKYILNKIPGIQLQIFAENNSCCGAGGAHLITHPKRSKALRDDLIDELKNNPPDILLTSNTGCALQLQQAVKESELNVSVMHPIELLDKQLG